MSLYDDYRTDEAITDNFPFGIPGDTWTTKDGRKLKVHEMTDHHIRNCMNMVGKDDPWYPQFFKELEKRGKA